MFLIDISPLMGRMREVELPLPNGETQVIEMTNLEWSVQYVKLKIQEMVRVTIDARRDIDTPGPRSTTGERQNNAG